MYAYVLTRNFISFRGNMENTIQETKTIDHKENDYGLVSIIMPTYKQKELLFKAVESVLKQSYSNIELIVVDDNEEEEYKNVNKEFFDKLSDQRVIYIQNEQNLGSTATRNKGIFSSNGKYITFLDDDDIYDEFKVEKQVVKMVESNAQVSVCNVALLNEEGKITDKRERKYLNKKEPLLVAHLKYHITCTDTMMYEAEFLKYIGGFDDENLGDEFYLMFKALEKEPRFVHVDYIGVYALVHSQTGLSSGDNKIKTEDKLIKFKQEKYGLLKRKDIRYIKMRHNVVLAMAHKKNKSYLKCLLTLILAGLQCPFGMLNILTGADR